MLPEDHLPCWLAARVPSLALALALGAGCSTEVQEHCMTVAAEEECPTVEEADELWAGEELCTSPVFTVKEVLAFVVRIEDGGGSGTPSGDWDACCYEVRGRVQPGSSCVVGRPLTHEGAVIVARVREARRRWAAPRPALSGLSGDARGALASFYLRQAQAEHASAPAFLRFARELRALGAPVELSGEALRALADERRHAAAAFALASSYAGRELAPAPLRTPPRPVPTLPGLAAETAIEGAVGETLAVLLAVEQLQVARDPAVRAALRAIIADETRHAALAWRSCRWALASGGAAVREALGAARARAPVAAEGLLAELPVSVPAGAEAHGLLPRAGQARVIEQGLRRVVLPAFEALLERS